MDKSTLRTTTVVTFLDEGRIGVWNDSPSNYSHYISVQRGKDNSTAEP